MKLLNLFYGITFCLSIAALIVACLAYIKEKNQENFNVKAAQKARAAGAGLRTTQVPDYTNGWQPAPSSAYYPPGKWNSAPLPPSVPDGGTRYKKLGDGLPARTACPTNVSNILCGENSNGAQCDQPSPGSPIFAIPSWWAANAAAYGAAGFKQEDYVTLKNCGQCEASCCTPCKKAWELLNKVQPWFVAAAGPDALCPPDNATALGCAPPGTYSDDHRDYTPATHYIYGCTYNGSCNASSE